MPIYKIAEMIVRMNSLYEPLLSQSKPYIYEEPVSEEMIDCDIPQGENIIKKYNLKHPNLTIGECEYLLYGTFFYHSLIEKDGILIHSSAVCYENKAYLFSAPCGTGKSTHTNIWLKVFKDALILNDDKPAIKIVNNEIYAFGTPFSGKTSQNINISCMVQALGFLERSEENWINIMETSKAVSNIFSQTILPYDETKLDKMVEIIEKIVSKIKIYQLGCNMDDDAARLSYNTMKEKL